MNTACLNNLVGIKSLCGSETPAPLFYLDDIEGMTTDRLSQLATKMHGSGAMLAESIKQSAISLMLADIDSLIPTNYRIKQELSSICSTCTFSGFFTNATAAGTGIIVKNMSNSKFTSLVITSLTIKVGTTGTFTLMVGEKEIEYTFVDGEEVTFDNVNYETNAKQINIYFTDPTVKLYAISCPTTSSCGCGGGPKTMASDIVVSGYVNGTISSTQYGIVPCVQIRCSYDNVICDLVGSSPRLFGVSLLYLMASKAFEENTMSQRVNRTASYDKEEKQSLSEYFYGLYRERLTGNPKKGILGVSSAIGNNLKLIKDKCVACDNPNQIAWAVG